MNRRILAAPGEWVEAEVFKRTDLPVGYVCPGPAIIEEEDSTTYIPPSFEGEVDASQCLLLTRVS
jgi:N-methylhydantoinase A